MQASQKSEGKIALFSPVFGEFVQFAGQFNLNSQLTDNNVYLSDSRGARRPEYAKAKDES